MHVQSHARQRLLAGLDLAERRVTAAGISTTLLEGGDGAPLVLLHGPGEHAPKWLRVAGDLARTHRVVVPDLPGHGASGLPDGPLDAARVLAWLGDLIDETCPVAPVLVGQIVGGAIAARFAAAHGDRVAALVLVDALGLTAFAPDPAFGAALAAFGERPGPDTHDELWSRCAHDLDRLRDDMGDDWDALRAYNLDRAQDPVARAGTHAIMGEFGLPPVPEDELRGIRVPTTLIWGRHDLATPLAVAQATSRRLGWPLHVVDGAADDPPIERPADFVRVLRRVLPAMVTA